MNKATGVLNRISTLYSSSKWHDIEFHIQTTPNELTVLFAHRLILASTSDVFDALCYGALAQKSPVIVTDIDASTFQTMLRYLYTDELLIESVDQASSLLYTAKKYMIPNMNEMICDFLLSNLDDNNCIDVYNLAEMFEERKLKNRSFEYIVRRLDFVKEFFSEDNLNINVLSELVLAKQLNSREITLVVLAQMWAAQTCTSRGLDITSENMRNLLISHNIVQNIRWSLLNENDYALVHDGLFSKKEMELFRGETTDRLSFSPRFSMIYMDEVNNFSLRRDLAEGSVVATDIKLNRTVKLKSILIIGKGTPCDLVPLIDVKKMPEEYTESLQVSIKKGNVQLTQEVFAENVRYQQPFHLILSDPVILSQDDIYNIELRLISSRNNSIFNGSKLLESLKNPQGIRCISLSVSENGCHSLYNLIAGFLCSY